MKIRFRLLALAAASALTAALLGACGGGSSRAPFTVVVFGDSLADGGTHGGIRATVQSGVAASPTQMFPDLLQTVGRTATPLCQVHINTGAAVIVNPATSASACTNFAVGGGRVAKGASQDAPYDIRTQMATAATRIPAYNPSHVGLIDGGGNDAADLVGGYLNGAAGFQGALLQQLTPTEISTLLAADSSGGSAGAAYMRKLADLLYTSVKTNLLDRGMTNAIVINAPLITNTPRFLAVLGGVQAANGGVGSATGIAAANGVKALATAWVNAFNAQLVTKFAGDNRVTIVDFFSTYNNQIANPSQYGLTNVTGTACPATGVGSDGLPTYSFPTCTVAALDASTPTWKTYLHSDGFHPTPLGHQLMHNEIVKKMQVMGWL